jgi:cytochrome c biogenesis protein ResB
MDSYPIEVNKPLRIGGIRIYQITFARQDRAFLRDGRGQRRPIASGEGFEWQGGVVILRGIEGDTAIFEKWEGHSRTAVYRVAVGERIGEYSVEEVGSREVTGLKAVKDPGFVLVVIALIIASTGLTLTLVQKGKDKQI